MNKEKLTVVVKAFEGLGSNDIMAVVNFNVKGSSAEFESTIKDFIKDNRKAFIKSLGGDDERSSDCICNLHKVLSFSIAGILDCISDELGVDDAFKYIKGEDDNHEAQMFMFTFEPKSEYVSLAEALVSKKVANFDYNTFVGKTLSELAREEGNESIAKVVKTALADSIAAIISDVGDYLEQKENKENNENGEGEDNE